MRTIHLGLILALAACEAPQKDTGAQAIVKTDMATESPEFEGDDATGLVRRTERNVNYYEELRLQGQTQQMVALHRAIGRAVDEDFAVFANMAEQGEFVTHRNMAVKCLAFAIEQKANARDVLLGLLSDKEPTLVSNAAFALGILRDKDTDMTQLVQLLGKGNMEVRTSAATAVKELWRIQETPRRLTPQHWAAIDRLVTLMGSKESVRARRAAAWALANLHHPDVLDHLIVALSDRDEMVQIGGLYGIERLGDARAIEALLEYMSGGPSTNAESWVVKALTRIATQNGFAKSPSDVRDLGTSHKRWRKWFNKQRMR